jgi:hypothetical protein
MLLVKVGLHLSHEYVAGAMTPGRPLAKPMQPESKAAQLVSRIHQPAKGCRLLWEPRGLEGCPGS